MIKRKLINANYVARFYIPNGDSRSIQPPKKIKTLESVTSSTMARVVPLKCMGANFFMKKQHYADMLRLAQTNCVNTDTVIENKRK